MGSDPAESGTAGLSAVPARRVAGGLLLAGSAAYSWWASGTPSFSETAYVAVGLPALILLAVLLAGERPSAPNRRPGWPWALVALVGAALEGASLALGGKDPGFPSLSTLADQLLVWHLSRAGLFALWLLLGAALWRPLGHRPAVRWPA